MEYMANGPLTGFFLLPLLLLFLLVLLLIIFSSSLFSKCILKTDMIEQDDIDIEEKHMARVCLDTLEALVFLHEHHRIHRDIKSDNMLMDSSGSVKVKKKYNYFFF